jgi:hypothetical protein
MRAKKLTARTQFVAVLNGATVVVLPGARFSADHPVAKAHREYFEPPEQTARGQVR